MDTFLSIITIIGFLVLLFAVLFGINMLLQWSANISGKRHIIKVNGGTLFDVKPNNIEYRRIPSYSENIANYAKSMPKSKPKNRKIFIYNPDMKAIVITFVE